MTAFIWCAQRAGGLSMIMLIALCYWVISRDSSPEQHRSKFEQPDSQVSYYSSISTTGAGVWSYVFSYYCLLVHILVCVFPLRACWAVWSHTESMKREMRSDSLLDLKKLVPCRNSHASVSSSETLISNQNSPSPSTVSEAGDCDPETYTDGVPGACDNVVHAIIIPNYKEELNTLKQTLDVLASHPQAYRSYDFADVFNQVYLGMEERESTAETKALGLIQEFTKRFRSLDFTFHPSNIPGEAAGKGSNIGWAARKLSEKYSVAVRKNIVVTGIDAVVRVADVIWCAAGMSGLYPGSSIAPPTSVYSLPLDLVDRVGGWDCGSEAIGEDLHMYIKCFFALNGNLKTRVIYSPVSQSNVTSGGVLLKDMLARYTQALRHMWGALDTGFALRKLVQLWQDRKQTCRTYQPLHCTYSSASEFIIPDSHFGVENNSQFYDNGIFSSFTKETIEQPHWENVFYMMHRLFEAHFLPVHMTILVIASAVYMKLTEGNEDLRNLAWIFGWCNIIRICAFFQIAIYMSLYESFHQAGVAKREKEMTKAGLVDGINFSRRSLRKNWIDYLIIPIVATLYGTIPSAQALICQLWSRDLVYTVSKKATLRQMQGVKVGNMA
ncbi:hypothetical protein F66182_10297 [Fusarium sp. NRRL 66182]|nr:hypothetical protein F66182_10297 [Fusarium sp. NRRL 66182]